MIFSKTALRFAFFAALGLTGLRGESGLLPAPLAPEVKQPHVVANLIADRATLSPGQPFTVALHLRMDPDWHTYWINPGDAGLATRIKWTLPPGFRAGPIEWPVPERHAMGPITTFGYGGEVTLLTTITPPADLKTGSVVPIAAQVAWLVCQEACIPGRASFAGTLPVSTRLPTLSPPAEASDRRAAFFAAARARLTEPNALWDVTASYQGANGSVAASKLEVTLKTKPGVPPLALGAYDFFPQEPNVLDPAQPAPIAGPRSEFTLTFPLHQNGELPQRLGAVIVLAPSLPGAQGRAIELGEFAVTGGPVAQGGSVAAPEPPSASTAVPEPDAPAAPISALAHFATRFPFLAFLLGAFLGGLILNLMPCVLPVLSLKVFALIGHAEDRRSAWKQGVAFTGGVVLSFWALAGLLLILRAGGQQLGWGFQMQSSGFVLALALLFFLLGLNLFGVFEFGTGLVGIDAKATARRHGLSGAFANGALATLAATPCTGPFMGSALGFAAQQSAGVSLSIFTALALGMAAPYLLLTCFPAALRWVPRPGAWMEALRQFMGFLLLATVIWLVDVLGALLGSEAVPGVLGLLLLAGFGAWIYGRWVKLENPGPVRLTGALLTLLLALGTLGGAYGLLRASELGEFRTETTAARGDWRPYSPAAVAEALQAQRPVFVDVTAVWCLSCKVNERLVLETAAIRAEFQAKNVQLLRADWTRRDPEISALLHRFQRDGIPLYLLYSPQHPNEPQVLPEVLTSAIVIGALKNL